LSVIENAIATLGIPGSIAVVIVIIFALLQLIGEFIEAFGKVAPTWLKLRKLFAKKKEEKVANAAMMKEMKKLLTEVNAHYSEDNIKKRNEWMTWVNGRAEVYDNTIIEYRNLIEGLTDALNNNTKMTEHMFAESSRDRIIDFAYRVSNSDCYISREEFKRIFKVYANYEAFLAEHNMTNGEVEINYQIIKDAYKERTEHHRFIEDSRN
jgi:hypothetical protein